ncbi:MAG TPA: hypothetical protein VGD69_15545, partial [Herpetosiphonaceae bacterium]
MTTNDVSSADQPADNAEILFSITRKDSPAEEGVYYANFDAEELIVWGPSAMTLGPDGSFWIIDAAANRMINYSSDGTYQRGFDLGPYVTSGGDVEVDGYGVYVLDDARSAPRVVALNHDGSPRPIFVSYEGKAQPVLELTDEFRGRALGLARTVDGHIVIEVAAAGTHLGTLPPFDAAATAAERATQLQFTSMQGPGWLQLIDSDGGASSTPAMLDLPQPGPVRRFLGFGPDATSYVTADYVTQPDDAIRVVRRVERYNVDGQLLGEAQVPHDFIYVRNGLAVDGNGEVYALITRREQVDIHHLQFQALSFQQAPLSSGGGSGDAPTVDSAEPHDVSDPGSSLDFAGPYGFSAGSPGPRITRNTIMNNARQYWSNRVQLSDRNLDLNGDFCQGRRRSSGGQLGAIPRYLYAPDPTDPAANDPSFRNRSMAYCWGGEETVDQYNAAMAQGRQAGWILVSNNVPACARGIDCSGFICRCWGRNDHIPT